MFQQVFDGFAFPDQKIFSLINKYFSGAKPGIVIGSHRVTICASIVQTQDIARGDFRDLAVAGKSIGFTNVTHYIVGLLGSFRIGYVADRHQ